jgi:hypothetical protein
VAEVEQPYYYEHSCCSRGYYVLLFHLLLGFDALLATKQTTYLATISTYLCYLTSVDHLETALTPLPVVSSQHPLRITGYEPKL